MRMSVNERSKTVTQGVERTPNRAMLRAVGFGDGDFNKAVSTAYGALYDNFVFDMHGVSKRSAFVVDKEGIIRYAEVLETATDLPNFDAIRKTLDQLNS